MPGQNKEVIVGVDVIRFAAAAMVMLVHFCTSSWADKNAIVYQIVEGKAAYPELFAGTWFGWVGVEIFFVISGLVIAYSAEGATARGFARSRVLRLYPAAWVCASITALTILALGIDTRGHVLRGWLGSVALFPVPPYIDPVYWTLGIEMAFYTLVFLLLAFGKFHRIELVALVLGTLSSAYWILGDTFAPSFLSAHFGSRKLDLSLVAHGCCFAVGTLAFVIARKGLSPIRLLAMPVFIAAVLVEISVRASILNPGQSALPPQLVFFVATMLIFVSMRGTASTENRVARVIRMVGLATYPLYLLHQIVGAGIMKAVLEHGGSRYVALGAAIAVCVLASLVIANAVEPPIRSAVRRLVFEKGRLPLWNWLMVRTAGVRKIT